MKRYNIIVYQKEYSNEDVWLKIDNVPSKCDCYRHLGITFDAHLAFHRAFKNKKSFIDLLGKFLFIFRKTHRPPWPTFIYLFSNTLFFNDAFFNFLH